MAVSIQTFYLLANARCILPELPTEKPVKARNLAVTGFKLSQTYRLECLSYQPDESQL
jgi:hypothetical protein